MSGAPRAKANERATGRGDPRVIRATAATLAAVCAVIGTYAVLAPHWFYRHVVGADALSPYGQHLLSDVGGLYLGFAVLFVWAARSLSLTLVRTTCAAFAVTQLMHFLYHARDPSRTLRRRLRYSPDQRPRTLTVATGGRPTGRVPLFSRTGAGYR